MLGEDYPGTDTPVFTRDSDTSFIENAYSALAFPNGDLVVGGDVEFATNVRAAQLSRYGGSGFRTWSTTPSSVATVLLDVALVGNRVVALGVNGAVNPTTTEIEVYDPDGNKLDATSLSAPEVYYSAVAIEPTSEDAAAVLIDTLPFVVSGLDATIVRVGFSGGLPQPGTSLPLDFDGEGMPSALAAKGATLFVCGSTDVPLTAQTQSGVLRVNADNTIPWLEQRALDGGALRCHDLVFDGNTVLAVEERLGATASNLMRYDEDTGDVVSVTPFPGAFWHVVVPADGRPLVAGFTYDLARLDGGAVDALGNYSIPGTAGLATDLLLVDDRPVVLGTAGLSFQDGDVRIVRPARFGQVACGRAGRCVGAICDDSDPCTVDGCNPTTGACQFTPRAAGAVCGEGLTCPGGADVSGGRLPVSESKGRCT